MSHSFTELGLLERENAAVMNACLQPLADQIMPSLSTALQGEFHTVSTTLCESHTVPDAAVL